MKSAVTKFEKVSLDELKRILPEVEEVGRSGQRSAATKQTPYHTKSHASALKVRTQVSSDKEGS
jgi:hypothetical protein